MPSIIYVVINITDMKVFGNALCESFKFRVVDNDAITRTLFADNIKCILENGMSAML